MVSGIAVPDQRASRRGVGRESEDTLWVESVGALVVANVGPMQPRPLQHVQAPANTNLRARLFAGPRPAASCGGYTTPARVRGWETGEPGISGSRETWGLSRLVTPAVVA